MHFFSFHYITILIFINNDILYLFNTYEFYSNALGFSNNLFGKLKR